jgi:outer membrane lipoprotein-sorting protein
MKRILVLTLLTVLFSAGAVTEEKEPTAIEILIKAEQMNRAKTRASDLKMTLIDKDGKESERKIKIWTRGNADRLLKFLFPADVKGVGFLVLNADSEDELMYIYLPALKKIRRIAGATKRSSFMGTDFTYNDIGSSTYSDEYDPERLDDEDDQYVLELQRKKESDADYEKIIMWVSKEVFVPVRLELYETKIKKNKEYLLLRKVLRAKKIQRVGKYWIPFEFSMEDIKKKHQTVLQLSDVIFDEKIPDEYFTKRYLQR